MNFDPACTVAAEAQGAFTIFCRIIAVLLTQQLPAPADINTLVLQIRSHGRQALQIPPVSVLVNHIHTLGMQQLTNADALDLVTAMVEIVKFCDPAQAAALEDCADIIDQMSQPALDFYQG